MSPLLRRRELGPEARRSLPVTVDAFLRALGGSSVLRVAGRDPTRTRVVTTLVHGNEPSGVRAVHAWFREGGIPATDVVVWIASVDAALGPPLFAHRALPDHRDLNRCFFDAGPALDGETREAGPIEETGEHALAQAALAELRAAAPEALIDLHNNTGHNPAYAVATLAGAAECHLAALFGGYLVHSDLTLGALVEATAREFPSVTIECGRAGTSAADAIALGGLRRFLEGEDWRSTPVDSVQVLVDPMRVELAPNTALAFADAPVPDVDLTFAADVDRHNFQTLEPGTAIGWIAEGRGWPLSVRGANGRDVSRDWFAFRDGRIETRRPLMPIMMTTEPAIAQSDCLCYVVRPAGTLPE